MGLLKTRIKLPRLHWPVDLVMLFGLGTLAYMIVAGSAQWTGEYHQAVAIDLSPQAVLRYTMLVESSCCPGIWGKSIRTKNRHVLD